MKSIKTLLLFCLLTAFAAGAAAQAKQGSLELSDAEGIPVLIKHLPDWENKRNEAFFTRDAGTLRAVLGERPVIALIDFSTGTEAVTAPYDAGRLLILEYTNPQSSLEDDAKFAAAVDSTTVYRRIGNYNAFVFDTNDPAAANALLDQIDYEKVVNWLNGDPLIQHRKEREFVTTTADIFLSTLLWIVGGMSIAIVIGIVTGFLFFRIREQKRASMPTFSDAGGMTRLNLDGFTPDPDSKYLLTD